MVGSLAQQISFFLIQKHIEVQVKVAGGMAKLANAAVVPPKDLAET
jgi:hypothetical protein